MLKKRNKTLIKQFKFDYMKKSLRELRTSVNLLNPKNGSKLPSRDFANPPNRYATFYKKHLKGSIR